MDSGAASLKWFQRRVGSNQRQWTGRQSDVDKAGDNHLKPGSPAARPPFMTPFSVLFFFFLSSTFSTFPLLLLQLFYIRLIVKFPFPVHPEVIPESIQVPEIVLFFTIPCSASVLPLGVSD